MHMFLDCYSLVLKVLGKKTAHKKILRAEFALTLSCLLHNASVLKVYGDKLSKTATLATDDEMMMPRIDPFNRLTK